MVPQTYTNVGFGGTRYTKQWVWSFVMAGWYENA